MKNESPHVIAPPPMLWFAAALLSLVSQYLIPWRFNLPYERLGGFILVAIGALVVVLAMRTMRQARTPIDPGRRPTAIVTSGPFRLSRNPIYLALLLWLIALGGIRESVWPFVWFIPFALVLHYGVVLREERYLMDHLKDTYGPYRQTTRRWL